jgi:hypothetical protein
MGLSHTAKAQLPTCLRGHYDLQQPPYVPCSGGRTQDKGVIVLSSGVAMVF